MDDREFLIWMYERLHLVHGESEQADYMMKLRSIIEGMKPGEFTPNTGGHVQYIDDLKTRLMK